MIISVSIILYFKSNIIIRNVRRITKHSLKLLHSEHNKIHFRRRRENLQMEKN